MSLLDAATTHAHDSPVNNTSHFGTSSTTRSKWQLPRIQEQKKDSTVHAVHLTLAITLITLGTIVNKMWFCYFLNTRTNLPHFVLRIDCCHVNCFLLIMRFTSQSRWFSQSRSGNQGPDYLWDMFQKVTECISNSSFSVIDSSFNAWSQDWG